MSIFLIGSPLLVRNKEHIDLVSDPPPDLVLEVEYSRSKIDKLSLYASMGVPEFWRYNGTVLRIYTLSGGKYSETEISPTFIPVRVKEIPNFITKSKKSGQIATIHDFRTWVKQQISS